MAKTITTTYACSMCKEIEEDGYIPYFELDDLSMYHGQLVTSCDCGELYGACIDDAADSETYACDLCGDVGHVCEYDMYRDERLYCDRGDVWFTCWDCKHKVIPCDGDKDMFRTIVKQHDGMYDEAYASAMRGRVQTKSQYR